jgi:hypothetical protein
MTFLKSTAWTQMLLMRAPTSALERNSCVSANRPSCHLRHQTLTGPQSLYFVHSFGVLNCFCWTKRRRPVILRRMLFASESSSQSLQISLYVPNCTARLTRQLISIAHRLQTVIYYDRIIVMDAGQVVEASDCYGVSSPTRTGRAELTCPV